MIAGRNREQCNSHTIKTSDKRSFKYLHYNILDYLILQCQHVSNSACYLETYILVVRAVQTSA